MHYTYAHTRNDTGKIFYIGKGIRYRANAVTSRNQYWKNIANKHGYKIEILAYWKTAEEALDHETLLISCFKDMGYELANLTDGGEGNSGYVHTEEAKRKMSESRKNMPDKIRQKISIANKGERNPFFGKKHSEETRKKMSEAWKNRESNWKNKKHSEESKAKMTASQKARWAKLK